MFFGIPNFSKLKVLIILGLIDSKAPEQSFSALIVVLELNLFPPEESFKAHYRQISCS